MPHHEPRTTGTKVCKACKEELPVICFSADHKNSDGLCGTCRECRRKQQYDSKGAQSGRQGMGKKELRSSKLHYAFHRKRGE